MTTAEKVNRIDLANIPKEYAKEINLIKEETNNFTDEEVLEVYQDNLDMLLLKINKRYPEAIKPKKKVILKKTEKKKVIKKASPTPLAKDPNNPTKKEMEHAFGKEFMASKDKGALKEYAEDDECDEAVSELKKIRIKREQAAEKRADAPKKQHQTLAAERQVTAFHHAVKTSDLKDDKEQINKFGKDLAAVYRKYGMGSIADKILAATLETAEKKKTAEHGATISKTEIVQLEKVTLNSLDAYEKKQYNRQIGNGMSKSEALGVIMADVDLDPTQLSPELAAIAEQHEN